MTQASFAYTKKLRVDSHDLLLRTVLFIVYALASAAGSVASAFGASAAGSAAAGASADGSASEEVQRV
jgi:hypothetical protein